VIGLFMLIIIFNTIIFSFIFWVLTYLSKWFYSNKYYNYKLNFYECGFMSLTNYKITYNINFMLLILFLLIYDGEFLVLIPIALNVLVTTFNIYAILFFFGFWLLITLFFDYIHNTLEWQV